MFVEFLYELRKRKVPVGAQEAVAVAEALAKGLHDSSLDGFYQVARALMVHSEQHLDDFDIAFGQYFRGIQATAIEINEELLSWLKDPKPMRELTPEERAMLETLDLDEVRRMLEERIKEQRERHDGGNRWVGTGGTSPFGKGGENPSGINIGGSSGRGKGGAVQTADARKYKPYRADASLDIRQIEVALRKLRAFAREGTERELDLDKTIDETARNAGELEVVVRPPRRNNTRVILMMDVGGSMEPHREYVSQLFTAAKRATHWRELRTYYFHNCVYGKVWKTDGFQDVVSVNELMQQCNAQYKLVLLGDALMAPYELLGVSGFSAEERMTGLEWLIKLTSHFERTVWLNPEPVRTWRGNTIEAVSRVVPMFPLTVEGLGESVDQLIKGRSRRG
ncbi:MAG: VWA domain-containing protein [Deltaproteobacteria bacterium]|nr:VWA domain-containing protein [Deltaproteobacteria bacterium]